MQLRGSLLKFSQISWSSHGIIVIFLLGWLDNSTSCGSVCYDCRIAVFQPVSCTVGYLSHTAVIWLPWFSHITLVRIAHCAIELTGCVSHNCVTL